MGRREWVAPLQGLARAQCCCWPGSQAWGGSGYTVRIVGEGAGPRRDYWVAVSLGDAQGDVFPPLLGNALHYAALAQSECLLAAWVLVLLRYVAVL